MTLKDTVNSLSTRIGQEIKTVRSEMATQVEMNWLQLANTTVSADVTIPAQFTNLGDMFSTAREGVLVAQLDGDYVSTLVPSAAVVGFPCAFSIHKGGSIVANITFAGATDTTFNVNLSSGTDRVCVFMR